MIACDAALEPGQVDGDEVGRLSPFIRITSILKWLQSLEEESLFVPLADGILPVYLYMYTTKKKTKGFEGQEVYNFRIQGSTNRKI